MTAPILRLSRPALPGAVFLMLASACGDDVQGPSGDPRAPGAPAAQSLPALVVSNPVTVGAPTSLGLGSFFPNQGLVYVSLPPGSVADALTAVIWTRGAEAHVTTTIVDGGFDPVAVAAGVGDTLEVRIELAGGSAPLEYYDVVPPSIPPVVVRTDPPQKKRDVPLNATMLVVFSEPIDASTLTASSVQLLQGAVPVAGALDFVDGANLTATFTPTEPLTPGVDYALLITREITDVDGDALAEEVRVVFGTEGTPDATTVLEIHADLRDGEQSVLVFQDGRLVQNSVVTLNGRVLGRGAPDCVAGDCLWAHQGDLSLTAGSPVFFEATAAGLTVRANGRVPETPVLTAPQGGSTFALADSIAATWTSATDPDEFWLGYDNGHFGCCLLLGLSPGVARAQGFAAADIAFGLGATIPIMLYARNTADFQGPVGSESFIFFWSGLADVTIAITP